MIDRIHQKLGTAGFVIAIVALVAALCGGAYAAGGGLNGKQKKEVKKIAKKFAGKRGPRGKNGQNGINGAPGPQGVPGADGAQGPKGDKGDTGSSGSDGAPGKSVEATPIAAAPGEACEERGGAFYEVEESGEATEICNGDEGNPWAVGGLPKGATETGVWTVSANEALANELGRIFVPISFSVPLREELEFGTGKVHFVPFLGDEVCTGNATEPTAPEGELCIYQSEGEGMHFLRTVNLEFASNSASKPGAVMIFNEVEDGAWGFGSWAVTGS